MKFIHILEEPIEPGGLVEWIPHTPQGRATWQRDPRLTSHNHEQHLRDALEHRLSTGSEGGRESWLGLAIEFDEPLSIPAVRAALTAWVDRHEVLRSHVSLTAEGLSRFTAAPGDVALRMDRIGWYSASGPMMEQIAGSFDRATAPLRWPAYLFATVGREDSFTLLFAADHSLVDGYALIMAQNELVTLYRAARDRSGDPELPVVGSYVDFSAAERRQADQIGADHPAVDTWSRFLDAGAGKMPPFFTRTGAQARTTDDPIPAQQSVTGLILDDAAANRFARVCAEAGGSLPAGVLAAFAIVHHEMSGEQLFRCVLPRHTRDETHWLAALGWFVALAPFGIDVSDAPTFDQAVARATDELKNSRQGSSLPYLRAAELLGHQPEPRFVISFIDTRYAPDAGVADAGRARVLRSHRYSDDEVYIWINRTPGGMRISARFPPEPGSLRLQPADDTRIDTEVKNSTPKPLGPDADTAELGPVQSYLRRFAELIRSQSDAEMVSARNQDLPLLPSNRSVS